VDQDQTDAAQRHLDYAGPDLGDDNCFDDGDDPSVLRYNIAYRKDFYHNPPNTLHDLTDVTVHSRKRTAKI
jgi:hypothetical protein